MIGDNADNFNCQNRIDSDISYFDSFNCQKPLLFDN